MTKEKLLLATMFLSGIVFGVTETVDGVTWRYTIANDEAFVGGGTSDETAVPKTTVGTVVIPTTLGGKSVVGLAKCAFYGCGSVTNVVIPATVRSIGSAAFWESGLSSVDIPDSVTSINSDAFYGCRSLENVRLSANLKALEGGVFGACKKLTSIDIPDSVKCIRMGAFTASCLKHVTIPGSVKSIHQEAFKYCTNMTSITISEGVRSIGQRAFRGCSNLTVVEIPNGVVNIGDKAFEDCSRLASVTIPDSVVNVGADVFNNCDSRLFDEPIPGMKVVDGWLVKRTVTPTEQVNLGRIRGICAQAFSGCSALRGVSFSSDIAGIGVDAFYGCKSLFCDTETIQGLKLMNGWVVGITDEPSGEIDLTGVNGIAGGVFRGCTNITSVIIPDGVRCIAGSTFSGCSSLTNITIPASVTCIGDFWAFSNCSNLRNITLPENLLYLGDYSFAYCNKLSSIYMLGDEPGTDHWFLFYYGEPGATVYVTDAWNGPLDKWRDSRFPVAPPTYTITYSPGSCGSGSQKTAIKTKNATLTLEDAIFTRTGYTQTGWATNDGGDKEYDLGAEYTVNAAVTLYPFWTANKYTVTFDANEGVLVHQSDACCELQNGAPLTWPTAKRDGYELVGWNDGSKTWTRRETCIVSGADIAFVASWASLATVLDYDGDAVSFVDKSSFLITWEVDTEREPSAGESCLRASFGYAVLGAGVLELTVAGRGVLEFDWAVNCPIRTSASVSTNGVVVVTSSSTDSDSLWHRVTLVFWDDGEHTVNFSGKGSRSASAEAWLDNVRWSPNGTGNVFVDVGGGKSVTVPQTWIEEHPALVASAGGNASVALQATAANGRMSVAECYVVGVDPESTTNDFKITSFPMKADGTPDLENIVFDPPEARWNVPGARPVVKGAASLDGEWQAVTEENKAGFRFFKVEVVLP